MQEELLICSKKEAYAVSMEKRYLDLAAYLVPLGRIITGLYFIATLCFPQQCVCHLREGGSLGSPPSGCQLAVCAYSETHMGRLRPYPMTILRKEHPIMIHGDLPGVLNRISCCMQLSIHSIPKVWASFGDIKVLGVHCL